MSQQTVNKNCICVCMYVSIFFIITLGQSVDSEVSHISMPTAKVFSLGFLLSLIQTYFIFNQMPDELRYQYF